MRREGKQSSQSKKSWQTQLKTHILWEIDIWWEDASAETACPGNVLTVTSSYKISDFPIPAAKHAMCAEDEKPCTTDLLHSLCLLLSFLLTFLHSGDHLATLNHTWEFERAKFEKKSLHVHRRKKVNFVDVRALPELSRYGNTCFVWARYQHVHHVNVFIAVQHKMFR